MVCEKLNINPIIGCLVAEPAGGIDPAHWRNDVSLDLLRFKTSHLPFSKEFHVEYQALCSQPASAIMNMKDTILLRALML